ncbi:aminoglycoside phosphotransferase [Sulfurovum lithotrophicum]|uniref:Aminoglycoside phosphotransferase n=1 Tax=Sulfurovum lithotrophicum TaxID=206403 RepID=A0A7U4RQE8_9BACT|nr:phosphotransferase [Sulfurovum lithotrophicum]AKF24750.1 aminoglycoside phosphotransferase [Sulfurovum lithotrophicum]
MYKIKVWLESIGWGDWEIEVASADASFRSYYRLKRQRHAETFILMDSSLMPESLPPFVEMNERLSAVDVHVPSIIVKNIKLGYLILENFGSTHYLDVLNEDNYRELYMKAIDEIVKMQRADTEGLPLYDRTFLLFEMDLMEEWYLGKYLQISISEDQQKIIRETLDIIADTVLEQPQGVFVHRDYHSRNIMLAPGNEVGVIDFQDARAGAGTYDLVSLLKDCYIEWPKEAVEELALYYRDQAGLNVDDAAFLKWFDFMGLQRHIKVLGIFSRLSLRDGKDGYLKDIPLTLKYVLETASRYPETQDLATMLKSLAD